MQYFIIESGKADRTRDFLYIKFKTIYFNE
jgi:hypothetical protein